MFSDVVAKVELRGVRGDDQNLGDAGKFIADLVKEFMLDTQALSRWRV
jgi:hypothetical protein